MAFTSCRTLEKVKLEDWRVERKNLMMGLIGMGNNPMVGATVAVAVAVSEAMSK